VIDRVKRKKRSTRPGFFLRVGPGPRDALLIKLAESLRSSSSLQAQALKPADDRRGREVGCGRTSGSSRALQRDSARFALNSSGLCSTKRADRRTRAAPSRKKQEEEPPRRGLVACLYIYMKPSLCNLPLLLSSPLLSLNFLLLLLLPLW
jgi:hypothetical protein